MANRKAEQKILVNGNKLIYREKCHNKRKYVKYNSGRHKYTKQNYHILTTNGVYVIFHGSIGSLFMGTLGSNSQYYTEFANEYKKHCKRKELKNNV